MERVVVFDNAGWAAEQVRSALLGEDLEVVHVTDSEEAFQFVREKGSLLILNLCLQPTVSFDQIETLAGGLRGVPTVALAGCGPLEAAARVLFPRQIEILRVPLDAKTLRYRLLETIEGRDTEAGGACPRFGALVGKAEPMRRLFQRMRTASESDSTILITGETGSGKGLAAKTIHDLSGRSAKPFVVVNCAELAESLVESELFGHVRGSFTGAFQDKPGLFEAADGGSVLLDEVADSSPAVQARLLRAVEEKEIRRVGEVRTRSFDARLIISTHVNLEERVAEGRFRKDLFFRLKVLSLHVPPLRERIEDLPLLVEHFFSERLDTRGKATGCSPVVVEILQRHDWPGNVRELYAVLEACATLARGTMIQALDLPDELKTGWLEAPNGPGEEEAIRKALSYTGGHRGQTAELLNMSRSTLWRRMKALGIQGPESLPTDQERE